MDVYKLRMKFGIAEIEAEGIQDYVEKQRDIFLERVGELASETAVADAHSGSASGIAVGARGAHGLSGNAIATVSSMPRPPMTNSEIKNIASQEGDIITLSALPSGETADEDSLVLLLLAHKIMRSVDSVPAGDLLAGMKQSGRPVDRLDGVFGKIDSTLVIRTGVKRGTKYRLTNPGTTKAKAIAEQLLLTVGQ